MPISSYTPLHNNYILDNLEKVVFLVDGNSKDIHIDQGAAYIDNAEGLEVQALSVSEISISDESALDERYTFTHTLAFTVQGYANIGALNQLYYCIIKDKNGTYWWANPMFPNQITHEFTASEEACQTQFTMAIVSNYPLLEVIHMDLVTPTTAKCEYWNERVTTLRLNEKAYVMADGDNITYSNDGFKQIDYDRNSLTFTERFADDVITQTLTFHIPMSSYKSSWHYNLLEFVKNTYCGVLSFSNDKNFAFGLTNGLQPSFALQGSDTEVNSIEITLQGVRANYDSPAGYIEGEIEGVTSLRWVGTAEHNAFECVGDGEAIYLLEYEADAFGNRTGNYRCLQGMEEMFQEYTIVGTFTASQAKHFYTDSCAIVDGCRFNTSLGSKVLTPQMPQSTFAITTNSSWSITRSSSHLTVSPSNGSASSQPQTITLRGTTFPSNGENVQLTFSFCDGRTMKQYVTLSQAQQCLIEDVKNLDANAQSFTIPYICPIRSISKGDESEWITNITATNNGAIRVTVATNTNETDRSATLTITNADRTSSTVQINQSRWYTEWRAAQGWTCSGTTRYGIEALWSGTTSSSAAMRPTYPTVTRANESGGTIPQSPDCQGDAQYRWTATTQTYCSNGLLYRIMQQQVSYDGQNWTDVVGSTMPSGGTPSEQCQEEEYEYGWYISENNPWQCGNGITGEATTYYALQHFTTVAEGSGTITFSGYSGHQLSYSTNNGQTWSTPSSAATVNVSQGTAVRWRGTVAERVGRFTSTANFHVQGNAMSLLTNDFTTATTATDSAFYLLFSGATGLTSAENLMMTPTTLGNSTCYSMFRNCTNLTTAPELPATTIGESCYQLMFAGCSSLTKAPSSLPASVLSASCYRQMFFGCTSLRYAPSIHASTLATECCRQMFSNCTSLWEDGIVLSATTLATGCYYGMFQGCTSIEVAPELPADVLVQNAYRTMFSGCTNLVAITMLATDISATGALTSWVTGVSTSGGLMTIKRGVTLPSGANGLPTSWDVQYIN